MSIAKELLIEKAKEGYTVCYVDECPLRTQCLRWQVGPHVPNTHSTYSCVNPHFEGVATAECPMYRNGSRLIPPALQEDIRKLFRANNWKDEVTFDSYVEDYDW